MITRLLLPLGVLLALVLGGCGDDAKEAPQKQASDPPASRQQSPAPSKPAAPKAKEQMPDRSEAAADTVTAKDGKASNANGDQAAVSKPNTKTKGPRSAGGASREDQGSKPKPAANDDVPTAQTAPNVSEAPAASDDGAGAVHSTPPTASSPSDDR